MKRLMIALVLLLAFAALGEAQTRVPRYGTQVIVTARPLPSTRVVIVARTPREAAAALTRVTWALQDYRRPVTGPPARAGMPIRVPLGLPVPPRRPR